MIHRSRIISNRNSKNHVSFDSSAVNSNMESPSIVREKENEEKSSSLLCHNHHMCHPRHRRRRLRIVCGSFLVSIFLFCWSTTMTDQDKDYSDRNVPIILPGLLREDVVPIHNIILGKARWNNSTNTEVVFAMSKGYNTQIEMYQTLIGSLLQTGYHGDIILGMDPIDKWSSEVRNYLKQIPNLVVYDVSLGCTMKTKTITTKKEEISNTNNNDSKITSMANSWDEIACTMDGYYQDSKSGKLVKDTTVPKSLRKFRYEHYWIWSQKYSPQTRILIVDARDIYFQLNPFNRVPITTSLLQQQQQQLVRHGDNQSSNSNVSTRFLYFFEERSENTLNSKETAKWIKKLYGQRHSEDFLQRFGNNVTLCSGTTIGTQLEIATYLKQMVIELNSSRRPDFPKGDQAHHNVLYYENKLHLGADVQIQSFSNYEGIVATIGGKPYKGLQLVENNDGESIVIDNDSGKAIPIIHQFDRHPTLVMVNKMRIAKVQ